MNRTIHRCAKCLQLACLFLAGIIIALLLSPDLANAVDSRSIRFQHISREQGLSQSFVYAIVQDRQGYLWFGTQEGLNRYDGFEFKVFANDPADPRSLSDETARAIIEDRSGNLWIGTLSGGLSRYDSQSGTFTNYLHDPADSGSISSNWVRVVYEDTSGVLWIGTDGSGLDRFDRETETFIHYPHDPSDPGSLRGDDVWSVLEDSEGTLWIATDAGLSKLDAGAESFTHYVHDPGDATTISDNKLRVIYEDRQQNLWIGTETGGLNRFDRANGSFERFEHDPGSASSISANLVNAIFQDDAGVLWIGTVKGLNVWKSATRNFERYFNDPSQPYSLSSDTVLSIYQDRGGVLWIGTYDGLSRWDQSTRAMLHYAENRNDAISLNNNMVMSFAEDQAGHIWVGTLGGGVSILDRSSNKFRHLRHVPENESSLSGDRVTAMHVDRRGVLWVGTFAAGLNRYDADAEAFTRFRHDPQDPTSLSADGVTYILEDSNNALWIGTFGGGLNLFDRETQQFRHLKNEPGNPLTLSNDRVQVLFEDSAGILWIGTYGGGLNRFDRTRGVFSHYQGEPDRSDGLSGDEIFMIQEDSLRDLWIGVKGGGLNRWRRADRDLDRASFQRFGAFDGLPSATIYSAVWDQAGHLWLSSNRGLSRLDVGTLEIKNYNSSHGLQGDEYNLAAGFRAADGQLFFGGMNGFNAFYPNLLVNNRHPPQVAITSILTLNDAPNLGETRSGGERLHLEYDQNVLGFEFAALDYAAPEKNHYRYQLVGFDRDWVNAGTQRQVTYANLPAGDYTFRVAAANSDDVWSEHDAVLDVTVQPAPWNTWWAYLFYLLILTAAVMALFRAHSRNAQHAAKLEYAEDLRLVQERLNEAQRIAQIGNWDWNIVTNKLWWSNEIYRLFQLDRDAFGATYESFLEHVHPADRRAVDQAVQRALGGQEPYSIDHRIIQSDGTERIVHERAEVTFDDSGQPLRMAGTVHDVTEQKKAENNIRRRADFQALLARLSSDLIRARPDEIDRQMSPGLEMVGAHYALDAISFWWFAEDKEGMRSRHRWVRVENTNRRYQLAKEQIPWVAEQLLTGESIIIDDVENMPPAAARDQEMFRQRGTRSVLIVPLLINNTLEGSCAYSLFREKRDWSVETVAELKLIADNLAGAIARSKAYAEIKQLKEQLQDENIYLREEIRLAHGFDEIVGEDRKLKRCLAAVEKVAPTDTAILVLGESGTGKELIARAIHRLSVRRDRPMVSVNCPTLPAEIIESELFGHEKGAFTGARSRRRGRFELADKGTIFLDEIGELPLSLQSKLLRVLQTGEFERLGGTETLRVDVRLIAATNRDLLQAVERGVFRADLYYCVSKFPMHLSPLRERKGDIPLLAEHFVHEHAERLGKEASAISPQMIRELVAYSWPGNIRELESTIERVLITSVGDSVLELPGPIPWVIKMDRTEPGITLGDSVDLTTVERSHILSVLEQTQWKISGDNGAAALLGIPSSTLRSKMKRLGIRRQAP